MSQSSLSSLANNHGFSLIELMVALVIASFVMLGVFQLFISSRQTFATHEAASRIYDNARVALQLMAKDISKTGYRGCVQSQVKGSGINNGEPALVSLLKYAGTGTPPRAHQPYDDLANSLEAYSAAGEDGISDEFTLRYQDGANSVRVLRTLGQTGDIIIAASDPHYSQLYQAVMGSRGGPLLATLSDCQRSIAFVISTITHHGNGEATVAKAINTAPAEPAKIS
jgi:prepilin-type N-terminal cleavage/methylation domain-containing protein